MIDIEYNLKRDDLDTDNPINFISSLAKSYGGGIIYAIKLTEQGIRNEGMTTAQPWGLYHTTDKTQGFQEVEQSPYVDQYIIIFDNRPIENKISGVLNPIFEKLGYSIEESQVLYIDSENYVHPKITYKYKKWWQFWIDGETCDHNNLAALFGNLEILKYSTDLSYNTQNELQSIIESICLNNDLVHEGNERKKMLVIN